METMDSSLFDLLHEGWGTVTETVQISSNSWEKYVKQLSELSSEAGQLIRDYIKKYGLADKDALIEYCYGVVTRYGEASSELACQMYDAVMQMEMDFDLGFTVSSAEPFEGFNFDEVGEAVNGSLKQSPSGQKVESTVTRLVKQQVEDTTLKNAKRDGLEFAWVPHGDTCPFCLVLASRGWQRVSKRTLKKGHAEHIHANCDCHYAVRRNSKTNLEGYDPDKYLEMYNNAEGNSPKDKINSLRRIDYQANREKILEQKRNAYAIRNGNKAE